MVTSDRWLTIKTLTWTRPAELHEVFLLLRNTQEPFICLSTDAKGTNRSRSCFSCLISLLKNEIKQHSCRPLNSFSFFSPSGLAPDSHWMLSRQNLSLWDLSFNASEIKQLQHSPLLNGSFYLINNKPIIYQSFTVLTSPFRGVQSSYAKVLKYTMLPKVFTFCW